MSFPFSFEESELLIRLCVRVVCKIGFSTFSEAFASFVETVVASVGSRGSTGVSSPNALVLSIH